MCKQAKAIAPGFIGLRSAISGKVIGVSLERICAYGQASASEDCWIALAGRTSLIWVRAGMEEVAEAIAAEQARGRG